MFKALEQFNSESVDTSQRFKCDLYFSAEQRRTVKLPLL